MRPAMLEFSGLHSYREPQKVDFTALLDGGLFGIFGPTGSGKSTILDAITLALYGAVERSRDLRSLINHGEKQVKVKFSFALQEAAGERRYRVERAIAREGEAGVRTVHCRLVDQTAGDKVLADKERDVTARVSALIGLNVHDFTRAVVLPQGKFAEFLQLEGLKRREMLERIFTLSQYGDKLSSRLKANVDQVSRELTGVQSAQGELGDASDEALATTVSALAQASAAVVSAESAWVAADAAYREGQKVWELQQELAGVMTARGVWAAREPAATAWRAELDLAVRAEGVRPFLDAARAAQRTADAAALALDAAMARLQGGRATEAEAVSALDAARATRDAGAPGLTERVHELQRAVTLEGRRVELAATARDLAARADKGAQLTADRAAAVAAAEQALTGLRQQVAALQEQMAAAEVPPELRQRLSEGLRALEALRGAAKQAAERAEAAQAVAERVARLQAAAERTAAERSTAEGRLGEQSATLARLEAEPPAAEEALTAQEAWLSKAEERVKACVNGEAERERLLAESDRRAGESGRLMVAAAALDAAAAARGVEAAAAVSALAAARAALDGARRAAMAVALAARLAPGHPCPVCGALEHPAPAHADGRLAAAEAAVADAEATAAAAAAAREGAERAAALGREKAEAAERALAEAGDALARAEEALAEARARLPETWRTLAAAALPGALALDAAAHAARRQAYQAWRADVEAARRRRDDLAKAAADAAAAAAGAASALAQAGEALADALAEAERATAGEARAHDAFNEVRGEYDAQGLTAEQARHVSADLLAHRLKQGLEKLRQQEHEADEQLGRLRKEHLKYSEALAERQVEAGKAQQALAEVEGEWRTLTGGAAAAPLLADAESRLRALESGLRAAEAARDEAARGRGEAETAEAAARREQELSARQAAETAAALASGLAAAGFAADAEAGQALRPPERRAELERLVREHEREGERLAGLAADLSRKLEGRSLEAGGWAAVQAAFAEARAALDGRREARARAAKAHEDLQAKQERWRTLEAERLALAGRQGHLAELQRVLAGKAFVEFLATEYLDRVALAASERLGQLTRHRYALEVDAGGGFIIRDDGNGGIRRPVATLSGGETFLASLALALALSAQIQLRGTYPLEFFFLDEGFGTLDGELLDVVISTLERLHFEKLHVGVISHVPELRSRLQRRVIVEPAEHGGRGSRLRLEHA